MPTITREQVTAAGLTPRSNGGEESIGNFRYIMATDASNGLVVVFPASINIKTDWIGDTSVVDQNTYVEGLGYPKTLRVPFNFSRPGLVGWEWNKLTDSQRAIVGGFFQFGQAIVAGVESTAADCAAFKTAADKNIAALRLTYGRGAGVPEDRIVISQGVTLKGSVFAEMARANVNARNQRNAGANCPDPFPQAAGASTQQGLNFPPPDGTINLGTGDAPIGVPLNTASTPTRNAGPWPVGSHSAWTAPANAWRNGEAPPPAFRFPYPELWFGPASSDLASTPGGTGVSLGNQAPTDQSPSGNPSIAPPYTVTLPADNAGTTTLPGVIPTGSSTLNQGSQGNPAQDSAPPSPGPSVVEPATPAAPVSSNLTLSTIVRSPWAWAIALGAFVWASSRRGR